MTQPTLYRVGLAHLDRPDPHTLTGRAVPYDQAADVTDLLPTGDLDRYREGFRAGAFDHQFPTPHRVRLVDGHTPDGSTGPDLAIATAMRNDDDGLMVDFRIFDDAAGKVETLLEVGVADLSVGFSPARMGTEIDDAGVRWRTKALLRHVSLEPVGAYPGAEVLAFRGDPDDVLEEADAEYQRKLAEIDEYVEAERARQAEMVADYAARGLIDPA
jgi:HK97 family phage prohead protease